ncbi:D-alanine--D-alanine ligase [Caldalkalibacillus mannanilyticus]|uniref:D-alanine--D-alanine ligase n=1 Tax=Caldalkalibacillus mannanilyticus TaxID=1418 RepID=UPI000467F20C|nr:D-alanine--D-alanine ligase [Caldalkalibacillus mannanilyticus]
MDRKIKVGIIFGGKSAEHEVSLQSAKNIIDAIDREKFEVLLIGIDKSGKWHLNESSTFLLHEENPKLIQLNHSNQSVALIPGEETNQLLSSNNFESLGQIDVVFPVLHGPLGEDGTIQGLLRMANIPFVGASVLGSAVNMDKDVAKRLLRDSGIHIANFMTLYRHTKDQFTFHDVKEKLGVPFFVKPANLGSSVGISKVKHEQEFAEAINQAFLYDHKVVIEECITGREIECSVLGNEDPIASVPGEILPQQEFYSYEAKYIDEKGALLQIPADLPPEIAKEIQQIATRAYQVLCCEGMGRVDFFLTEEGEIILNEINTIPGFTRISMYPKLWEASGISYSDLITKLIQLSLDRHRRDQQLKDSYV